MPARNALKLYSEKGYYHVYNRGVAKNLIFLDEQDYLVFMAYLKDYLMPPRVLSKDELLAMETPYLRKNYFDEITLLAFVLMPNHFHLLLKQNKHRSIEGFMRSLITRYVKYFNRRHERVGHLFQDVYKGILIDRDEYLWWLTRYIHRNPLEIIAVGSKLVDFRYSSYPAYLRKLKLDWVSSKEVLLQVKDYRSFVEDGASEAKAPKSLPELLFETGDSL